MAELTESKMNLAALKRVDPYVKSLLETAAHVALYNFVNNEWEKTDIEGALFVYSRTGEPFHNILIMNRLNMKNLVEPITQGLDLQLQDPFLLYRTAEGSIYGIWFYDKDECVRIASTLTRIIKESSENKFEKKGREPIGKNVDIFSMLSKAQEEYNSKSPQKSRPEVLGIPLDMNFNFKEPGQTPQSVMDFFAKASNGSKFQESKVLPQQGMFMKSPRTGPPQEGMFIMKSPRTGPPQEGMFMKSLRTDPPPGLARMPSLPINIPPQNDVKPLLQRLMSNPVHSVEHIEKQQRSITPQNELGIFQQGNAGLSSSNGSVSRNGQIVDVKPNTADGLDDSSLGRKLTTQNQVENSFGFLRISDSSPVTVHSQQFFNSKLGQNHSPLIQDGALDLSVSQSEGHRPFSAPMETHLKPALMPPVMFTSSVKKEDGVDTITTTTPTVINSNTGNTSYTSHPEPLTKNQLIQALNYLMKHDPEFMNKLHEAYVKSFSELVS